ncbi:MAG: glutaminyl-peptide cyclotransferase [Marinilabiliaceae bacterium]|jgi:glutamine cyclotransferase|nr:glutaminyl-peptide cyclotransferase [Marinilabiliaceae bacterium]
MIFNNRSAIRIFVSAGICFLAVLAYSCGGNTSTVQAQGDKDSDSPKLPAVKLIEIDSPKDNQSFASGDLIDLEISLLGDQLPDSVRVYLDGSYLYTLSGQPYKSTIETASSRLGKVPVKAIAYLNGKRPHTVACFIRLFSDIIPPVHSYSVVNEYPHDRGAYTQGLLYHNGLFYESTGPAGKSSLREVDPVTGSVLRQHKLDNKFFGEGLVLLNKRLYQLTWEHNTGFVYDLETFSEIKRIHYDTQGWGLATDGSRIFMSDGTNKIYFLEPEYFTVTGSVDVYDDKKAVYQLNELEYINGELWANIYMSDLIARIDPDSGKVLAYINLAGIMGDEAEGLAQEEVLNGIAWDSVNSRLYVTGKNWPKLFEIKVR